MAVGATPRLGLPTWGAGTDAFTRAQMNGAHQALDDLAGIDIQVATAGDLPAAALPLRGTYAAVLDTGAVYRCNGSAWVAVSASSVELATSPPGAETFGAAGVVGTSGKLARADHRHQMPAHDATAHNGVSLSALAAPTGALAMGGNRITNIGTPSLATDAASKAYVDTKASASVTWSALTNVTLTAGAGGITTTIQWQSTAQGNIRRIKGNLVGQTSVSSRSWYLPIGISGSGTRYFIAQQIDQNAQPYYTLEWDLLTLRDPSGAVFYGGHSWIDIVYSVLPLP